MVNVLVFNTTGVKIVNTIKWTGGLDKYFKENEKKDSSLLWQYFGSSDGVYRVYPGKNHRFPSILVNNFYMAQHPLLLQLHKNSFFFNLLTTVNPVLGGHPWDPH